MIRSFRWGRSAKLQLNPRAGRHLRGLTPYVWEETGPETLQIYVKTGGESRQDYYTGTAGRWRRLGPWITPVENGNITITSRGGAANFSGIEVWRRGDGSR